MPGVLITNQVNLWRRAVLIVVWLMALYTACMVPAWMNDHRVARLVDRITDHPPPASERSDFYPPQAKVTGSSGDCFVDLRFELYTEGPTEKVLDYYTSVNPVDADESFVGAEYSAWIPQDESGGSSLIIDVNAEFVSSFPFDLRCW